MTQRELDFGKQPRGERKRLNAQCLKILDLLESQEQVTNTELQAIAINYTARISELRGVGGYDVRIVQRNRQTGVNVYQLFTSDESTGGSYETTQARHL
jgi:hypothetical protein